MKAESKYYGLPFKGSKCRYAKELFDLMPHGGRLVDLFCGGCSMTDYAMENKLYDSYLANDKDAMVTKAYIAALNDELVPQDMRFISKDYFHSHPDDPYSHICYSFNCRLVSYMYGTEAEVAMKAVHYVACYDDYSLIKAVINSEALLYLKEHIAADDFYTRRLQLTTALRALSKNNVDIGSTCMEEHARQHRIAMHLCKINRALSVAKPYSNLTTSNISYEQYEHHDGDVVYCDPPYAGTEGYGKEIFDTERFWQWARTREYPVYVSEFNAPDDFVSIWEKYRPNNFSRPTAERNCQQHVVENLFIHERFL